MRWIYLFGVALAVMAMGCGRRMTPAELDGMAKMNAAWVQDIAPLREVLREAAVEHKAVFAGVGDTASIRYKAMRGDSLGRLHLQQSDEKYSRWFSTASALHKRLDGLITANRDWFRRLPQTGTSLLHARRSWDARREEFYTLFQSCKAQIDLYPLYKASLSEFKPAVAAPVEVPG
jgi:hypothetical protein